MATARSNDFKTVIEPRGQTHNKIENKDKFE